MKPTTLPSAPTFRYLRLWILPATALLLTVAPAVKSTWAINITSSPSAPFFGEGSGVQAFQPTSSGSATGRMIYTSDAGFDTHWISAQIFQAQADFNVDKYVLQIQSGAEALQNAPVKISLYSQASGFDAGPAGGFAGLANPIHVDLGTMPATLSNNDYITFDVTNLPLTSGNFYSFAVDFQTPAVGQSVNWAVQGTSTYGPGQMWDFNERDSSNFGASDFDPIGDDMLFFVFDDTGGPPTPPLPIVTPNATRTETFSSEASSEFVDVNSPHLNGHNFGFSNTNHAGGTAGEAGGTFARAQSPAAYADIDLTDGNQGDFDRTKTLHLSGDFTITGSSNPDGNVFVGYLNDNLGLGDEQFIGLGILEPAGGDFRAQAWIQDSALSRVSSGTVDVSVGNTYSFDLTYVGNPDGSGTLSGTIAGMPVTVSAGPGEFRFDKFGIGSGFSGSADADKTVDIFFDNLTYSIFTAQFVLGDMNGDGVFDNFDIAPFALALADPQAYEEQFPLLAGDYHQRGDINGDEAFDNFDIAPFAQALTEGGNLSSLSAVPEPSSLFLLAGGGLGLVLRRRRKSV